jgi:predicted nuclease with TOPRIM domain
MKNLFPEGTTLQEIKDNLQAMSWGTKTEVYQKPLTSEELAKLEKEFIQNNRKFAKLKDDFNKMKEDFKAKMKPIEKLMDAELGILKTNTIEVEGIVYMVDDQENRVMNHYDEKGNFLYSRPLLLEEKQISINSKMALAVNE